MYQKSLCPLSNTIITDCDEVCLYDPLADRFTPWSELSALNSILDGTCYARSTLSLAVSPGLRRGRGGCLTHAARSRVDPPDRRVLQAAVRAQGKGLLDGESQHAHASGGAAAYPAHRISLGPSTRASCRTLSRFQPYVQIKGTD